MDQIEAHDERLVIDNGSFNIAVNHGHLGHLLSRKKVSDRDFDRIWQQLQNFAADVERSRAEGVALGSTDPVGAIEDQIHRFNLMFGSGVKLSEQEIESLWLPAAA